MEELKLPLIGDKFPKLEVQTTRGKKKLPDAYKGKWFILFSHPADFTPVCTTEFYAFQKRYNDFKKLNTELIGLSVDQLSSCLSSGAIKGFTMDRKKIMIEGEPTEQAGKLIEYIKGTLGR